MTYILSDNKTATSRIRYVDSRYQFVRLFIEKDFMKILFIKSEETLVMSLQRTEEKNTCNINNLMYLQDNGKIYLKLRGNYIQTKWPNGTRQRCKELLCCKCDSKAEMVTRL